MILWRIAADSRSHRADDLSGAGSAKYPGRWNNIGQRVLYTAPTVATAVLESAAHINDAGLPLNRYLVEIAVPDAIWSRRKVLDTSKLNVSWAAVPGGRASAKHGSDWIKSGSAALLVGPSVIVPEEPVVVINTDHPDAAKLSARIVRLFEYNRLFRAA